MKKQSDNPHSAVRLCSRQAVRQRAFALVEILVVIAVIAILVAIVVGVSGIVVPEAARERTMVNMRVICLAIEAYRHSTGVYPPQEGASERERGAKLFSKLKADPAAREKLATLSEDAIRNIDGDDCFVDGGEHPLDYDCDGGVGGAPVLVSAGADGNFGTEEDNIRSDGR